MFFGENFQRTGRFLERVGIELVVQCRFLDGFGESRGLGFRVLWFFGKPWSRAHIGIYTKENGR